MTGIEPPFAILRGSPQDAAAAAALHESEIAGGFLSSLGLPFLTRLYRRVSLDDGSTLLVAEQAGRIVGFLAGTVDVRRLYRRFLARDGLRVAAVAAPRLLHNRRQALETLRYPATLATEGSPVGLGGSRPSAELLAMAVHPSARRQGVGRELVSHFLAEMSRRSVPAAVVVAAEANQAAITLYRGAGFRSCAHVEVHTGSASEMLIWP